MIFRELPLAGAFEIEIEPQTDARGSFARTFCVDEFEQRGMEAHISQCNLSVNARAGTLRGLHFQAEPHGEAKLVRCGRGALWDVIVDLRPDSETRNRWSCVELTALNGKMLYIPKGFAQGFQTLEADTEVVYHMSAPYQPSAVRGIRWDDPKLAIDWPRAAQRIISERDRELPTLEALEALQTGRA